MKKIRFDRLEKLANHLKSGKLGHKKFDFRYINGIKDKYEYDGINEDINYCGSLGCAMGELPCAFPKIFKFTNDGIEYRKEKDVERINESNDLSTYAVVPDFFNITHSVLAHLFHPCSQHPKFYGGRTLGSTATAKAVANNILAFIKKMKKEKITTLEQLEHLKED